MWNPRKLIIKNLMSHLDTEYEFLEGKCVMIYGENESDDGADSNGSGKSVILEAITLALTNEITRDVNRDEFINDSSDSCFVSLTLTNSFGNVNELRIEREIFRKKKAKITIFENKVENKEITSVNEANSRVYELIGLDRETLLKFFLIGQNQSFSFLLATDSIQKEIISKFSKADFLTQKVDLLKSYNKKLELDLQNSQISINRLEDKIELLKEQKNELNQNNNSEIESIKQKIEEKNKKIIEKDKKIKILKQKIEELSLKIKDDSDILIEKLKSEKSKLKKIKQEIDSISDEKIEFSSTLKQLKHLKEESISCPECKCEFLLDSELTLEEIGEAITEIENSISAIDNSILVLKKKKEKIVSKITSIEEQIENQEEVEEELRVLKNKLKIEKDDKKIQTSSIESLKIQISELKKDNNKNIKIEIDEKIKNTKKDLVNRSSEYELIKAKIDDNSFWIHHFSKKGFLTFLTNKSIKSIEGVTNFYLQKINTNLQVEINGYTVLKSGDLSDKISISILRSGKSVANYHRFSGGEKGRINICNIVGLQKLINMSCPNGGLNFLGLDEVFEGLDLTGQKETIKILEEIGVTTLVVSHRSEPIGVENELIIRKIGDVSKIIKKN